MIVHIRFSQDVTAVAYARIVRALMALAHGRLLLLLHMQHGDPHSTTCAEACMRSLQGDDLAPLPQQSLCCDLATMSLLENIIG